MWFDSILIVTLLICVITDIATRKIYNKVIYPGLLLALFLHFILGGWGGLGFALSGILVGLGLLLIPYLMGGMGAGDVKLLALIGALKGTVFVLNTAIYMALLGGVMALFILVFKNGMQIRIRPMLYFIGGLKSGVILPFVFVQRETLTSTFPYGVAITGGAVLCLILQGGVFG